VTDYTKVQETALTGDFDPGDASEVLRRFEVYSEQDDGGVRIDHQFKDCDWDVFIDGYKLTDLIRQATAHAKVCDGKPQPLKPPQPPVLGGAIQSAWNREILAALQTRLATS
jgi:hypothetical protein